MGNVRRIEQEIAELSPAEIAQLRDWFLERDWQAWDAQLERDARAGKLEALLQEAKENYRSGRAKEL